MSDSVTPSQDLSLEQRMQRMYDQNSKEQRIGGATVYGLSNYGIMEAGQYVLQRPELDVVLASIIGGAWVSTHWLLCKRSWRENEDFMGDMKTYGIWGAGASIGTALGYFT